MFYFTQRNLLFWPFSLPLTADCPVVALKLIVNLFSNHL